MSSENYNNLFILDTPSGIAMNSTGAWTWTQFWCILIMRDGK